MKKCPKCRNAYYGHPALSRVDNKTEICQKCGQFEALRPLLLSGMISVEEFEEIIQITEKYEQQYRGMFMRKSGMDNNSTLHSEFLGGAGN